MAQSTILGQLPLYAPDESRAVPGWPYEVNAAGTVVRRIGPGRGTCIGTVMRFSIGANNCGPGYLYLQLSNGQQRRRFYVHELVALAFLGPRPYKCEINHKDGDHFNNHVSNLEYVTHRQNMNHSGKGLFPPGERHPRAKLRAIDVAAIRACIAAGKENAAIARFFNVRPETVDKIWRGDRWAN